MLLTAARWGFAFAILAWLGRRNIRADWPAIRPKLILLAALGALGFSIRSDAAHSGAVGLRLCHPCLARAQEHSRGLARDPAEADPARGPRCTRLFNPI